MPSLDGQTVDERVTRVDGRGRAARHASLPRQLPPPDVRRSAAARRHRDGVRCRPRVIVLDEPTTGLDVTTQRRVLDTVRELTVEHQVTSVYVSHDLAVVAQLADQTAVIYAGRLVEHATTEALFRGARHPYTVGLLKAVPSPARSEILVGIEGRPPRPGRWPSAAASPTGAAPSRTPAARNCRLLRDLGDGRAASGALSSSPSPRCRWSMPRTRSRRCPGAPKPVLAVRNLAASYGPPGGPSATSRFDVTAGRCTAVVGQSGFGQDHAGPLPGRAAHRLDR